MITFFMALSALSHRQLAAVAFAKSRILSYNQTVKRDAFAQDFCCLAGGVVAFALPLAVAATWPSIGLMHGVLGVSSLLLRHRYNHYEMRRYGIGHHVLPPRILLQPPSPERIMDLIGMHHELDVSSEESLGHAIINLAVLNSLKVEEEE